MVAPGAKGSFPSSTDDATKPKNIIALSNPHTRTTGFQGTRMYMAEPPGTKSGSRLPLLYCEKPRLFMNILPVRFCQELPREILREVPACTDLQTESTRSGAHVQIVLTRNAGFQ